MQRIFSKGLAVMNRQAAEHLKHISHPSQLPAAEAVAGGSRFYRVSVLVQPYEKEVIDRFVSECVGTGRDAGPALGSILASATFAHLRVRG